MRRVRAAAHAALLEGAVAGHRLRIGELKKRIHARDGQQLWEDMYGSNARGLLDTLWRCASGTTSTRAQSITSAFAKGTFLIRFSQTDAALPVLVVSNGVSTTPSKYKVRIQRHKDDICFCYQTVRKGMQTADTLYEVLSNTLGTGTDAGTDTMDRDSN